MTKSKIKYSDNYCAPAKFYYIHLDFYAPGTESENIAFAEADKNHEGLISIDQYR